MATITAPQTQGFVSNTSPLDKAIVMTDTPQVVSDKKIIQKIKFEAVMQPYANTGVLENSWFMRKFGSRLQFENGFNPSFWDGIRPGQTIAVTMPIEITGDFGTADCDDCADVTYASNSYDVLYLKGGCTWTFAAQDCPPCPGNNCGTDAYDLEALLNNTLRANRAFAKAFDYALFTGKNIKDGSAITGFATIFGNATTSTTLGKNYVSDLELTLAHIKDEIGNLQFAPLNGVNAGLNYLKARNLRNDLVIFATARGIAMIREHYNTMVGSNFQTLAQPSVVGNIANTPLTVVGKWDSTFDVVEVPSALMPAGNPDFVIGDFGSLFGKVICAREAYPAADPKNPFTEYYVKRWSYIVNDLSAYFGKYSYIIPKRDDQSYDMAVNTVSSTGTSAQNPTFTKTVA